VKGSAEGHQRDPIKGAVKAASYTSPGDALIWIKVKRCDGGVAHQAKQTNGHPFGVRRPLGGVRVGPLGLLTVTFADSRCK
jgi:hypothetical protein